MPEMSDEQIARLVAAAESERVAELEAENRRLRRDKERLKDRKRELAQVMRQEVRACINELTLAPVPLPPSDDRTGGEEVAVALLSDWQLGKETPDYNSKVCERRIRLLARKIERLTGIQRADHPVKTLHAWMLGDHIEGELIYPGQAHEIDSSLYRQVTVDGPRIAGDFLRHMLRIFDTVRVVGVPGNHGALAGRSRRDMHPESNADLMLYSILRQLFAGEPRISFDTYESETPEDYRLWYAVDRIGSYSCLLFHGHQIQAYNTFPWYGFARRVLGWHALGHNQAFPIPPFRDAACGHFHTPAQFYLNGIMVRANGTVESYNVYAQEQLASMGEPCQHVMFVDPEAGRVTAEYRVSLGAA